MFEGVNEIHISDKDTCWEESGTDDKQFLVLEGRPVFQTVLSVDCILTDKEQGCRPCYQIVSPGRSVNPSQVGVDFGGSYIDILALE